MPRVREQSLGGSGASQRDPWSHDVWASDAASSADGANGDMASEEDLLPGISHPPTRAEAAQHLADYLISLKNKGTIRATHTCLIAYWAQHAGIDDNCIKTLAFPPGRQSGKYSDHFDRVMQFRQTEHDFYKVRVPGFSHVEAERSYDDISVLPPHEAFARMLAETPDLPERVRQGLADGCVPPSFAQNPIVRSASATETIVPLAVYIDGVPVTRRDGLIGYYMYSIIPPSQRYLIGVLRSQDSAPPRSTGGLSFQLAEVPLNVCGREW